MTNSAPGKHYVVQKHQTPAGTHWDLMLEAQDALWTWRIDSPPAQVHNRIQAERIVDHPLKFLSYEGPVQNGTGSVVIVDHGDLEIKENSPGRLLFSLKGKSLRGWYVLELQTEPVWFFYPTEMDNDHP